MAEKMNCRRLVDLRKCTKQADLQQQELIAGPFVILRIDRYVSDPQHTSQTGLDTALYIDAYQLTVADSTHKLKVVLDPQLFTDIQNRQLREGCSVTFDKCAVRFDECDLSGNSIIIVHRLTIDPRPCLLFLPEDMADLPWSPDCGVNETKDLPLTTSRGYFLDLWSSVQMTGDVWKRQCMESKSIGSLRAQDVYKVKDVSKKWWELKSINPPLILRVLGRCRLLHYAKPHKADKWPFQAHFSVCDETGVCNLVLWNALCADYYHRLPEGCVILIRRFTVKKSYYGSGRDVQIPPTLEYHDVDINLNPHHPPSELQVLALSAVPRGITLPPLEFNFITRKHLGSVPNDYICDIVGCVTYVGRYERDPINKSDHDSGGFWVRRWLHLRDSSTSKLFIVQMFRAAESPVSIGPGAVVVCRHMRVVNNTSHLAGSKCQRSIYVTSTINTQVSVVVRGGRPGPLRNKPAVKSVVAWSQSTEGKQEVELSSIGGCFSYPGLPSTLAILQEMYTDLKIVPSDDWVSEVTGLSYRQHKRLFVQAVLLTARLVRGQKSGCVTSPIAKRKTRRRKVSKTGTGDTNTVVVDPETHGSLSAGQLVSIGAVESHQIASIFPVQYSVDQWPCVSQQLMFPSGALSSEVTHNAESSRLETDGDTPDYFILTWTGLNTRVLLNTIWRPCEDARGTDTRETDARGNSLSNLLCEERHTLHWLSRPPHLSADLPAILHTAAECRRRRYLLVVDCYRHSHDNSQEVVLSQAYVV